MHELKGRVLLVEDEDSIRLSLRDFLKRKGYKVSAASDGVGAIQILLDSEIDIIVTDYRMESLGGDYWIRFLKRFCPDIDVVITSGFLKPDFHIPFRVLLKPFDYAELETIMADMLRAKTGEKNDAHG